MPDNTQQLRLMHEWLDFWSGLGLIVVERMRAAFEDDTRASRLGVRWAA